MNNNKNKKIEKDEFEEMMYSGKKRKRFLYGGELYFLESVGYSLEIPEKDLIKGLKKLGILNEDNTPNEKYIENGVFPPTPEHEAKKLYRKVKTDTALVSRKGFAFIMNICADNPKLFPIGELPIWVD